MLESMLNAFRAPDIRRRLLFVLGILVIYRALAHVLIPGINPSAETSGNDNGIFGLLTLFSGGNLRQMSIVGLGLNPYINATIIMQILQSTIPSLQALSREGEYGRNKITSYSRWLSVPLAALQSYGILSLLNSQFPTEFNVPFSFEKYESLTMILALTTGSIVLMWLGELITEKGIGNGISFIIFAGIVSRVPGAITGFLNSPDWLELFLLGLVGLLIIFVIIFVQEGQRRIPIQYANRVRGHRIYQGGSTFLPLRVNMAGVIPIIFAISILLFPAQIAAYFSNSTVDWVKNLALFIADPNTGILRAASPIYLILYFLLTFAFAFFYTFIVFKPDETANNLRKAGGFIPGIRPGAPTEEYLRRVALRITVAGAFFVASVAVLPMLLAALPVFKNLQNAGVGVGLGGTSILIVVSVVVETMKQLEAQLMMRSYEGFIR
jgi:preprotein translocase subunit SecY